MNGSVFSRLLRRGLALVAVLLLACSGEEDNSDFAPTAIWPDQDLVAVALTGEDRALVVGQGGEIYLTVDAGASWQLSHTPIVSSLRAMVMADSQRGWVAGNGAVLRTDDGGSRWRRQRLPGQAASMRLVGVGAVDAAHALVVGVDGLVLRTDDGGGSWVDVGRSEGQPIAAPILRNDVFCRHDPDSRCWFVGHGLERAGNGVENREFELFIDYSTMPAIRFDLDQVELSDLGEDQLEEFVALNRQRPDLEWILEPGLGLRETDSNARGRDPTALFDLITARLQEVRTVIEEGGVPPERIAVLGEPPWDYENYLDEDVHFLDRYWAERLVLGSGIRVSIREWSELESLRIEEAGLGLAVGRSGTIVRTDDRGAHWQTIPSPTPHDLYGIGIGSRRVVVVGAQGGLWTSNDEGRNWQSAAVDVEADSFETLREVSFSPSGEVGFIVGEKGRILRSLDGGESWIELRSR